MKTNIYDIKELQRRVIKLEKRGPASKYHIRKNKSRRVKGKQLADFERNYKVMLPNDLKEFLLHFGASGMFARYAFLINPSPYYDSPFHFDFTIAGVEFLIDNGVTPDDIENVDYDVAKDEFDHDKIQALIGSAKENQQYVILGLLFGRGDCGHTQVIIMLGQNKGAFGWYGDATFGFHDYKGFSICYDEFRIIEHSIFDYEKSNLNAHISFLNRIANGEISNDELDDQNNRKGGFFSWFRKRRFD
ncbi:MAG: hypothetical protein GQ574_16470 [Crocinitomix sp.]|nr:hypothetical protein [Crocinitomix sp.]